MNECLFRVITSPFMANPRAIASYDLNEGAAYLSYNYYSLLVQHTFK